MSMITEPTCDLFANCVCAHQLKDHYVSTSRTGLVIVEECLHPDCLAHRGATPDCLHFRKDAGRRET